MINMFEVNETNNMITQEKLDVRTITMGISLLDCIDSSVEKVCENVYNKITTLAKNLVSTGKDIEKDYGIPIVNKQHARQRMILLRLQNHSTEQQRRLV